VERDTVRNESGAADRLPLLALSEVLLHRFEPVQLLVDVGIAHTPAAACDCTPIPLRWITAIGLPAQLRHCWPDSQRRGRRSHV
jgi:hypothetical protein